ncbi:MAG TPA: DUF6328 family protein [Candidatus Sulfotelmatobacter sp.]|nr:DUF6328 family protein [Candidatus Sulfotelmatobacter sp.]
MIKLSDAIENVLNEARMLLLGGQVLLGFGYRVCFEAGFERLPASAQLSQIAGLGIMTAGLGWLIWPAAFHQIRENGAPSTAIHNFTTNVLDWGLLPLAVGLPLTIYPVATALHISSPALIAAGVALLTFLMWYAWSLAVRDPQKRRLVQQALVEQEEHQKQEQEPDLSDRIKKVLIECRMALPGAQAFLGFQFAIVFTEGFSRLPRPWQLIHFISLLATTVAIVLLIAPAAYHRLAEAGADSEHFHKVASRLLLAALVFLAPGMAGDLFVVIAKISDSSMTAGLISGLMLAAFYALWFGISALRKK